MIWNLVIVLLLAFSSEPKNNITGESEGQKFQVIEMASDLHIPWGFDFLDSQTMIFTEKNGKISLLNLETKKITPVALDFTSYERGQGGLMDIKIHPNYPEKPWIYITKTDKKAGELTTTLARFQLKSNKVTDFNKLLVTNATSDTTRHFGSRITFDEQGFLYFSVGERGRRDKAQDLSTHAGSVLRLMDDGSVPKDNPFYNRKNAQNEIWSYGHRNPQGLVYDKDRNILWEMEHGPQGGDEINRIKKAKNYGWPVISYGEEYGTSTPVGEKKKKGMMQPVHYYVPSIAPCGLEVYSGKAFPKWKGDLFSGALKLTHLNRVVMDQNGKFVKEERLLKDLSQRVRNVKESPEGHLYISTDSGYIYAIKPSK